MLFAMSVVIALIAYFAYETLQDKKRVLDEKTNTHRQILRDSYQLSILDIEKELNHYATKMISDRRIVDAFEARDRDKLYTLALPYFKEAHAAGKADLTGFIKDDGTHFLRLQDPKKFGDNLTKERPMIAMAIQTQKPIVSLDVTLYNISLVSIMPIFKDSKFLGIVQVSAKIDRIQERLNAHSGIKSAIAFDTNTLAKLLPNKKLISYGQYSLVSYNDKLFEHLPKDYVFSNSVLHKDGNATHIIASRELNNYANKPLGYMICMLDITKDETAYEREIRKVLIVGVVMLLLLFIVLYIGFEKLIRKIRSKSAELTKKMYNQLHFDSLTQLPNRLSLFENLHNKQYIAIILLNIDNFKEMNDLYGHEIGDKILQSVAKTIAEITAYHPISLYKMHADEYALALNKFMDIDAFDRMCESIVYALDKSHYEIDGISIFITISIGADICMDRECDLIGRADMALKTAKKRGFPFVKYSDNLQIKEQYENNIFWSKKLKETIEENRFELFFQSIHETTTQHISKYEALIRIIDKDGTIISPYLFLEIAKKSRLYTHITEFVIKRIFQQLQSTPHHYSINLSVDDILNHQIQDLLYGLLAETNNGNRVTFEILESDGIENYEEVSAFINHVKEYGCHIAIDDFGTGYSNFAHIMKLNVDYIKIDGSLIKRLDYDASARDIVQTIVEFSHRLKLKTVAEFVCSKEIYDECQKLGIDYLQGFYLSEPKPNIT